MNIQVVEESIYPAILVREWEMLLSDSRRQNPFLTPIWNEIWLRHFGQNLERKVLLFRAEEGTLQALGTFSNSSALNGRKGLALLGGTDVWDYRDLVISSGREEEVFHELARFLAEGPWDYLDLSGISEFSPTVQFLPSLMQSHGFQVEQEMEEIAVYLNLPSTWEAFLENLNSKDRHELRRKIRRAENEAFLTAEGVTNPLSLAEKMKIFFDLHRKSRKDKAEFMTPQMENYFRDIAIQFQQKGWLNLTFLGVQGREVATFLSFDFSGTEYLYNSGYDPQYGRFSPGIVLAARCIRQAIEKGMTGFNFLRGQEDYKYRLGGKEEKIYRIRVEKK